MKFSEMPYVRPDPEKIKKWTAETGGRSSVSGFLLA